MVNKNFISMLLFFVFFLLFFILPFLNLSISSCYIKQTHTDSQKELDSLLFFFKDMKEI